MTLNLESQSDSTFTVYSAEVEDYFVVAPRQRLELVVGGEEHHDVGLLICFFVAGQLEHVVLLDVWLYDKYVGVVAALHHLCRDIFSW